MSNLEAMLLGVVQGLTEFLPISPSGHLIVVHEGLPSGVAGPMVVGTLAAAISGHAAIVFLLRLVRTAPPADHRDRPPPGDVLSVGHVELFLMPECRRKGTAGRRVFGPPRGRDLIGLNKP
jgi:Bacitracin resistance protein BacA